MAKLVTDFVEKYGFTALVINDGSIEAFGLECELRSCYFRRRIAED